MTQQTLLLDNRAAEAQLPAEIFTRTDLEAYLNAAQIGRAHV